MVEVVNLFKFLKEFNEISNPVVTEIERQKWNMKLKNMPKIPEIWNIYEEQDFENEKLLEVVRPQLKPCESPEDVFKDWLIDDYNHLSIENIRYKDKIGKIVKDQEGNFVEKFEFFDQNKERVEGYNSWIIQRKRWREEQITLKQGLEIYNLLFRLYSEMNKDSESVELMLGDGRIRWYTEEDVIDHPIVLQKVVLEFVAEKPSFIVRCEDINIELYTSMLRGIESINQSMLVPIVDEVENCSIHISDVENIRGLLKRIIAVIDKNGELVENKEFKKNAPVIYHEPVLFLRKRNLGYSSFIDKILEELVEEDYTNVPSFFNEMLGYHKDSEGDALTRENYHENGVDKDVLLTLPANMEQLKIIKYLDKHGAVLVQGPPGTGKTHTIANLIGHLLSQGSRVLVTSHTEKALSVLKEKVYKELQSLCISLLSASSQRKEMDAALFDIAEKSTSLDLNELQKTIHRLSKEREDFIDQLQTKSEMLLKIRAMEYQDILFDHETVSPLEAAKFIHQGKGKYDYLSGQTSDNTMGFPIELQKLQWLYKSNQLITREEELNLLNSRPNLNELWDAKNFQEHLSQMHSLQQEFSENEVNQVKFASKPSQILFKNIDMDTLCDLREFLMGIIKAFHALSPFQLKIIEKVFKDSLYAFFWEDVFAEFDVHMKQYQEWRRVRFENTFEFIESQKEIAYIDVIEEMVKSGHERPISIWNKWFKPSWNQVYQHVKVNNKNPETKADFEKILFVLRYEEKRKNLFEKINKLLREIEKSEMLNWQDFEEAFIAKRKSIENPLNWKTKVWEDLLDAVQKIVQDQTHFEKIIVLKYEHFIESLTDHLENLLLRDLTNEVKKLELKKRNEDYEEYLNLIRPYKNSFQLFEQLVQAVEGKSVDAYKASYVALKQLYQKEEILKKRYHLLKELKAVNPTWVQAIVAREGVHGLSEMPDNIQEAWKWLQLNNQFMELDRMNPNQVQNEIEQIHQCLRDNAKELAYAKAWFEKIKNITTEQTQAIEGWRQTIKKIGKGTGKRAAMYMSEARALMPKCQSAIPVWIMSFSKVVQNFDPRENKFDVIIVDEASQASILALSVLYLGKKIIIVGDDEQVSPAGIGVKTDEINALITQHLTSIPNHHLYDEKTSLYDMAKTSGFKPLMLTEHFRCLPDIIAFSNALSYNGKIKPLRDISGVTTLPAVVNIRVENAVRTENKVNLKEAKMLASFVCACIENPNYKNKTIGVISLLGEEQAREIEKCLQNSVHPVEYEKRKIQCGTPPQFQGDERDIIFLSVVEGPKEEGGPVMLVSEDGRGDMYRKRYNVAASRAKDQLWVVHSLNIELDLKPEDIRRKLIQFAQNPEIFHFEQQIAQAESDFEKKVIQFLRNKGYRVTPQWSVGAYRIDMVIEDGKKKIALECDGEQYHTIDDLPMDMKRQAILERLGWKFIRIRGSVFYRDPEKTMADLCEELSKYDIYPNDTAQTSKRISSNDEASLIDVLKRRAREIYDAWDDTHEQN